MQKGTTGINRTPSSAGDRRVTLKKDLLLEFPELWMEVYVSGPPEDARGMAELFIKGHCTRAKSPEEADLVVFTGGPDVNPILYDEERHHTTLFDSRRDEEDIELYTKCFNEGIPMFGICRGAQFLHVMNGGKLYQHVDNHVGDHGIFDIAERRLIGKVSSVHHQMVIRNIEGGMTVIADCGGANTRWKNPTEKVVGSMMDVEAFFYRDTCAFGVQGHPEYSGYGQFAQWTLNQLNSLIVENPDLELQGRYRRMKTEFLAERNARIEERLKDLKGSVH